MSQTRRKNSNKRRAQKSKSAPARKVQAKNKPKKVVAKGTPYESGTKATSAPSEHIAGVRLPDDFDIDLLLKCL